MFMIIAIAGFAGAAILAILNAILTLKGKSIKILLLLFLLFFAAFGVGGFLYYKSTDPALAEEKNIDDMEVALSEEELADDVTEKIRVAYTDHSFPMQDYACSYYKKFFKKKDELHYVINTADNTTNRVSFTGELIEVDVYNHVPDEELSAKTLPSGTMMESFEIDPKTGKPFEEEKTIEDLEITLSEEQLLDDVTGKIRIATTAKEFDLKDYILLYAKEFIKKKDELHFIINTADNTTTRIARIGDVFDIDVYTHVEGEENSAKTLPSGIKFRSYQLSAKNGHPYFLIEPKDIADMEVVLSEEALPGDVTGKMHLATVDKDFNLQDYALSYYETFFKKKDELHFLINTANNTTSRITRMGDVIDVVVYEHVEDEELSAKTLPSGAMLESFRIDIKTGKLAPLVEPADELLEEVEGAEAEAAS